MKQIVMMIALLAAVAGGATYYVKYGTAESETSFRTVQVKRGDLILTISATGTVEPEELVDVGAQVAGLITEFGRDAQGNPIDYNSVVEAGTVLALIDPTPYKAALRQAEATLERSKADLLQLEAKYEHARQEWKRAETLRPLQAISDTDYDASLADYKAAEANVAVGKATIQQNEASLEVTRVNLGYTTIKSPVRGKIIARRVNIGQTVVASLNAPSLFLIAKDLRRMEVWASVNEADIGQIREGMTVRFTVDAFPDETFRGTVKQVRLDATMTSNIVAYTVVVTTDNSSGKLLPYLTANVQFEVGRRENVLLVPSAALRWKPEASKIDAAAGRTIESPAEPTSDSQRGCLWVPSDGGLVRPVEVQIGASDGLLTEVSSGAAAEGMRVVVGENGTADGAAEEVDAAGANETSSPFMPKPPKGHRPPPGPM